MATVVIVDDAAFMRGSLRYILEQNGHEVVGEATDGAQALELYKRYKPDVVTLDILMRGTDGFAGLKAIKKYDPGAKVIMVTALGQEQMQKETGKLGASGYIRKPFSVSAIITEIDRVLSNGG